MKRGKRDAIAQARNMKRPEVTKEEKGSLLGIQRARRSVVEHWVSWESDHGQKWTLDFHLTTESFRLRWVFFFFKFNFYSLSLTSICWLIIICWLNVLQVFSRTVCLVIFFKISFNKQMLLIYWIILSVFFLMIWAFYDQLRNPLPH